MQNAINELLAPIRQAFQSDAEAQATEKRAYPPPAPKIKKVKNKGTNYAGATGGGAHIESQTKADLADVGASVEDAIDTFNRTNMSQ